LLRSFPNLIKSNKKIRKHKINSCLSNKKILFNIVRVI